MLYTSQVTRIQQPQAQSQCSTHPGLDFDTICFNQACRQKGNQIICSNCGQQEPHTSHMDQQYAIHRTSPGFRSISFTKDWYKLPQLIRQREKIAKEITNLKIYFIQLFNQMADCSLRKLQCLSDLLSKNAAFNVCHKMRQNPRKHLSCCMDVINDLQMHQQGNILCKEEAYTLIQQKLKNECSRISHNIGHLKSSLIQFFGAFDKKHSQEGTDKNAIRQQTVESTDIELGAVQADYSTSFCITEQNHPQNDFERQQESRQKSLIYELNINGFSPQLNQRQKPIIKCELTKRPPIGIEFETEGSITVWDSNPKALSYLRKCQNIKNLIIQDSFLTNTRQFQNLIKNLPQLQGIHINCKSSIDSNVFKNIKLFYLNFLPTFRFIQNTDRSKYFPKVEQQILENFCSKYFNNVYKEASFKKRNIYIFNGKFPTVESQLEQINFIRQHELQPAIYQRKVERHLVYISNLLILTFSNIALADELCLNLVYKKHQQLHTVVFDSCKGKYRKLILHLKSLRPNQLRHLQVSGDKIKERIVLGVSSIEQIFYHQCLETLILTSNSLGDLNTKDKERSFALKNLSKLDRLTPQSMYVQSHLDDSWPIQPKILEYLHKNCRKQLRYLNIGCSEIADKQRFYKSPPFYNIQSLCLDYTEINQAQLAIFMKNSASLKYLSIQNLNGQKIESEQTDQSDIGKCYGLITPQFFMGLHLKSLKYVNIYNCFAFSEYSWEGFDDLECIRVNEGLLSESTIQILKSKGIKLNIVRKDGFQFGKTQSIKRPFKSFNGQQNQNYISISNIKKLQSKHYFEQTAVNFKESSIQESIDIMARQEC